ncbi:DUF2141 domain-containing protein [Nostoc sp. CMAA1605]|uniref:DUF2141 domain-containing protein n=1 Tax=Nostoc sp. CMAA1605 TaxID=2055159 RepID=UPI001F423E95|nr:DUF2141 domain-containing protein [Nostoc sp. CMAA1605]MCF4965955.1 hypothetical protein [Nostoc sp. CMAA1605]
MLKKMTVSVMLLAAFGGLTWSSSVKANFNGTLTVEIDGLKNQKGQICASVFTASKGFPSDPKRVVQSQCTTIGETPVKVSFDNLQAGSYAVAVIHDQNSDRTLNRNNLGIPLEGFGFSRNPEVRTKAPEFSEAAFILAGPNTNIQIQLKYF